jgi:polyvinyl alcohol dehydrogenase (cytochrome)
MITTSVGFIGSGPGVWIFAVRFDTGVLVWKSKVTDYIWAVVTDSPLIYDGYAYFGTSSSEPSKPYIQPDQPCCSFVGTFYSYKISNGQLRWSTPMIPSKYYGFGNSSGMGNYSGCGIWGSTPALGSDNDIYFGTGEFCSTPNNVSACNIANPLNQSCVPADIHMDSIIRININTGVVMNSFRTNAADTWNIACYFNALGIPLPGCVSLDIAFDFDITTIQYSKKTKTVYAGSKSGYKWSFTQNLTYRWTKLLVEGGSVGGYSWQGALRDDKKFPSGFSG